MALRANDPRSKQRQIADDIRRLIADGTLQPGDQLPPTRELMERYKVSNQTVQGGLRYLTTEGLTQAVPGRGTFVREDIDPDSLTHGDRTGEPSPEYVALRGQLEALVAEVGELRQRLSGVEDRISEALPSSAPAETS